MSDKSVARNGEAQGWCGSNIVALELSSLSCDDAATSLTIGYASIGVHAESSSIESGSANTGLTVGELVNSAAGP